MPEQLDPDELAVSTDSVEPVTTPARRRKVAPFVALVVAALSTGLVFVFAGATGGGSDPAATPLLNKPAPGVHGLFVDDDAEVTERVWHLSRQKGDWVVLNFFDSTCVPCVNEHPELVKFAAEQEAIGGAQMVSVAFGASPAETRNSIRWLRDNDATWDVIHDNGSIANAFAVAKVPETWIIDPYGFVVRRYISEVTAEQLSAQLDVWTGTGTETSDTDTRGAGTSGTGPGEDAHVAVSTTP